MALHVLDAIDLTALGKDSLLTNFMHTTNVAETNVPIVTPQISAKPYDKESVVKWYNIVLIDTLTILIGDLNAKGEVCLLINRDGKAYMEENGGITIVYEFGEMPDVTLWGHITEKLGEEGLFAEVQEGNCLFISWA